MSWNNVNYFNIQLPQGGRFSLLYCVYNLLRMLGIPSKPFKGLPFLAYPNDFHIIFSGNLLITHDFPHFMSYRELDFLMVRGGNRLEASQHRATQNGIICKRCVHDYEGS